MSVSSTLKWLHIVLFACSSSDKLPILFLTIRHIYIHITFTCLMHLDLCSKVCVGDSSLLVLREFRRETYVSALRATLTFSLRAPKTVSVTLSDISSQWGEADTFNHSISFPFFSFINSQRGSHSFFFVFDNLCLTPSIANYTLEECNVYLKASHSLALSFLSSITSIFILQFSPQPPPPLSFIYEFRFSVRIDIQNYVLFLDNELMSLLFYFFQ